MLVLVSVLENDIRFTTLPHIAYTVPPNRHRQKYSVAFQHVPGENNSLEDGTPRRT